MAGPRVLVTVAAAAVIAFTFDMAALAAVVDPSMAVTDGLYPRNGTVVVFDHVNLKAHLYGKPYAWFLEFYNSWCGFCRRFAPEWSAFADGISHWAHVVRVGAIDCASDGNNGICRDFEIMGYPMIKFFSENYTNSSGTLGRHVTKGASVLATLVKELEREQADGNGVSWPPLHARDFFAPRETWEDVPLDVQVVIAVFEPTSSTLAGEVILDLFNVTNVRIWSVSDGCELSRTVTNGYVPSAYAIEKNTHVSVEVSLKNTRAGLRDDILAYLLANRIELPPTFNREVFSPPALRTEHPITSSTADRSVPRIVGTTVFQSDIEAGLRYTLVHEMTAGKEITGDALLALIKYLQVMIKHFPSKANTRNFLVNLLESVAAGGDKWTGEALAKVIKDLEYKHSPVYSSDLQWVACKGSSLNFRGFTCSVWTIFHVLTVQEAQVGFVGESEVLAAMLGYVRHFFGCAECSKHFQVMVVDVPFSAFHGEDRAIYWLWYAHNKVNQRLVKDSTEDPQFPKRQFPYEDDCPNCRYPNGNWDMDQTIKYYKNMYMAENIQVIGVTIQKSAVVPEPLSKFDIVILGFLYAYCFLALTFIIRLFFTKKINIRRIYLASESGKA